MRDEEYMEHIKDKEEHFQVVESNVQGIGYRGMCDWHMSLDLKLINELASGKTILIDAGDGCFSVSFNEDVTKAFWRDETGSKWAGWFDLSGKDITIAKQIKEGKYNRGGVNPAPTTPRPNFIPPATSPKEEC